MSSLGLPCAPHNSLLLLPPSTCPLSISSPRSLKLYGGHSISTGEAHSLSITTASRLVRSPETSMESCRSYGNGIVEKDAVEGDYAEIIVVRHGETEWNSDGRIQGHLDVELNQIGKQQAAAVANRLSKEGKISAVYSSDLKRASETAQAIATACGGLEVIKEPELRERNLGDLQGLQLKEAAKLKPLAYEAFLSHQSDQELPGGGESIDQLYKRCTSSLETIARKHKGERVVVVTHGGVIRSLCRRACPSRRFGKVLNTSINIFHLYEGDNKWVLRSSGDVSHLDPSGFLDTGFGGDRTSG
ncbi:hypothetical protein SAY87_020409 [Trapa incisa]|uniref:Phosphoglycerate mutase n=1 Tax=Trapa incisa TaxID=236973 RepID=A0AAN7Q4C9_9MYRT|nr:hypothetical protein SAY87_020409 [Trapa incisa]